MPKRGSREVVVNQNGGYWVRSKPGIKSGRRASISARERSPPRRSIEDEDTIIVEDAEHGKTVYHASSHSSRPRPRRERSYSEPEARLPTRRAVEDVPRPRRRDRDREAVIVERGPSPPRRRRKPSPSPSASTEDEDHADARAQRRRRGKSSSHPRVAFDLPTVITRARAREPNVRSSRAAALPPAPPLPLHPPPPPYQPPGYAPGPVQQPYYGQPMMEAPRQGGAVSRFGKKLGNAAIFGFGFEAGADLLNAII